jgi:hypothetical protein
MRRRSKPAEVRVVVLSASGTETHSLRLTRKKVIIVAVCWLLLLIGVAAWGFQSAGEASESGGSAGARDGRASRQK